MPDYNTFSTLEEIKAVSFFSTSLSTKESIEEVLWSITKDVIHRFGFVDCVIYTYNEDKLELVQQAAYGSKNPSRENIYNKIKLDLGEGIVGSVAASKKAEIIHDTSNDPRYIVDDAPRLSEICVPILVNGELFGVIDSEHPEKAFFTEKHLHLLHIIAALCGQRMKEIQINSKKPFSKANEYFKKLEQLMKRQKIYRNPSLSLSCAAEALGISACYLSSMINALLKKSFIDFVNEYRVNDVKRNLLSDAFEHYTVVSVGLEAGFNSKSAFYHAFKKHTGLTPVQYKNSSLVLS